MTGHHSHDDGHSHEDGHSHDDGQGHGHGHGHGGGDFDWEGMAQRLERDATVVLPIVDDVVHSLSTQVDWANVRHLLDLGCGPGVITCALAGHAPAAQVTALDSSVPLLTRVRHHAAEAHLSTRVHTLEGDMETMPPVRPMDVVWAGMVLHHVSDPASVLRHLAKVLQPGGTLVMIEFAGSSAALPAGDPLTDAWDRMEAATTAARNERLGLDPNAIDWAPLLSSSGYTAVTDTVRTALHPAPLAPGALGWLVHHLESSIEFAGDRLPAGDVDALRTLAASAPTRDDLTVRVERRVLTAQRPR